MDPSLSILANVLLIGILYIVGHNANPWQILRCVCLKGSGSDAAHPWFLLY